MCGIVGIYYYKSTLKTINRSELRLIRDHMLLRGPDAEGEWYSDDNKVALGHRRLSIIDLSDSASQPMSSHDGRYVITFNGEIYNHRELRKELEVLGYQFYSRSDTEVLIYLYAEKGAAMLNDLRGMFSFSLWDNKKKQMFIARDPYGIKPLYYADNGESIRIASQVKSLIAGGKVSRAKSSVGTVGFFLFGHMPEPYTQYKSVFSLKAGHYIFIDEFGVNEPVCYFNLISLFKNSVDMPKKEARSIIFEAMEDSLKYHLVSDVPVGVFLSAGIDSGAILSLAGASKCKNLETLTLSFEEFNGTDNDESPLASKVSLYYNTAKHHHRMLEKREFLEDMDAFFKAMDQPTTDGLNTYFVSKAVSELGWKVALSGIGGDEMFCGYPSFNDIPKWVNIIKYPSKIPGVSTFFSYLMSHSSLVNPKLKGLLRYGGSYSGAYLLRRGLFLPEELPEFLGEDIAEEGLQELLILNHISECKGALVNMPEKIIVSLLESSLYMRNQLLRDADWASMAHSLEIRTPFVDAYLIKKIAPVLMTEWNTYGKELFSLSLKNSLPKVIQSRAKTGFATPLSQWLKSDTRLDAWKRVSSLNDNKNTPWARRWAYIIADREGLV